MLFRIRDLQKLHERLLLVLQMTFKCKINKRKEKRNVELKMDAGFPLVSGYLKEFTEWINQDEIIARSAKSNGWVG